MAKIDMTQGNIAGNIVRYSIPLVLGNLFQLTYNLADSAIAGQFIGKDALAAEGIASPVMNILILGISGLSMGAGVLMSEFFGSRNIKKLKEELSTVISFGFLFSIVAVLLCIALTTPLLHALSVPEEIMGMTGTYLRIIFLGVPFTYFYNTLAAALKSVGDSKTPLKFLMLSSILNAVLDIIFIGFLHFGIVCSATTTVIAEGVSAGLSYLYIRARIPELAITREEFRPDKELLKKTLSYGATTALQQSCQPIGKLLIQGCVNTLGVDTIAAFNAVTRIDDFAFTPEQSISHGITTFVAQNHGKASAETDLERSTESQKRITKGFAIGLRLEFAYWLLICALVLLLKKYIMLLFVSGDNAAAIIEIGSQYLKTMAFFYLFPAFTNGIQGFFRGYGKMKVTLLATFIQTSIRVLVTYILAPRIGIYGISFACAIGWSCMLLYEVPYYLYLRKRNGNAI
ncbi:MAG: MATE family efflux transporter [Butyrivibrio sp.]|nr:MATE family efflux transporter [Muribaculum sp.]MCM1551618.1 MATE family efflux transporter [Butyrivibrio sp.]